jgi:hypothetical protein
MKATIYAIITLITIAGATAVRSDENQALHLGLSRKEVSSHFKGIGTHQFTALKEANTLRCVSYSFGERFIRYYFLFKNDELVSVLDTQPFFADAFDTKPNPNPKYAGTKISVRKPWSAKAFMSNILETTSLSPKDLSAQVETRLQKAEGRKKDHNVLPAFVILAPLIVPDMITRNAKHKAWLSEYDPFKIDLGSKRTEVEAVYGKPQFIMRHDKASRETHAYGPLQLLWRDKTRVHLGPLNKRFWVAVVYESNIAVQIFSNDLFNDTTIVTLGNKVKKTKSGEQNTGTDK